MRDPATALRTPIAPSRMCQQSIVRPCCWLEAAKGGRILLDDDGCRRITAQARRACCSTREFIAALNLSASDPAADAVAAVTSRPARAAEVTRAVSPNSPSDDPDGARYLPGPPER